MPTNAKTRRGWRVLFTPMTPGKKYLSIDLRTMLPGRIPHRRRDTDSIANSFYWSGKQILSF